ncbi:tetratricopeptide repeat protein [Chitinophaga horti]|uniref:Tetratricopeptide repeat protein n=1 Tax=Chitinophaga horti TaxID=2920382 RepID=A0ABY6J0Y2_9BACT|nr:tetratricopeptide repeat protein [Chitinophaga horti]UYQ92287.1 tetratricopeptide repeat protein [Chitinophaga horti]
MRTTLSIILIMAGLWAAACKSGKNAQRGRVSVIRDPGLLQQRADSFFYAAQRSKMLGDYRTAITHYSDCLRLDPDNATAYYEVGRLFMELRNAQYALGFTRKAVVLDSTNKWFKMALADAFAVNEMFDSAALVYATLSRQFPENDDYKFNHGAFLSRADKLTEALNVFTKLEEKTGPVEEVVYQRQKLLVKLNRLDEAAAEIHKLVELNPDEPRYYLLLAELYDANDMIPQAKAMYDTILQKDPYHPRALIAFATYAKKERRMDDYWKFLTRAFANPDYSIDEKVAYVFPYLQMQSLDSAKLEEGLLLSNLIINAHPEEAKAFALRADMFSQADIIDSALVNYRKAVTLDSSRFTVWYQLMWLYSRNDQADSLLHVSETATQLFPQEFMGFYFNGMANYFKQQYDKAVKSLNRSLQIGAGEPRYRADVYALLGDVYHATGQHRLSDSSYDNALAIRPKDDVVLNNYSYYLSMRGEKLEKAEQMSRYSLELRPDNPVYLDTYAWILFRMGRYELARQWIEKALQHPQAQQDPDVLEHYGDILFNLKEEEKAVMYWQQAKEKGASSISLARKIAEKRYIKPGAASQQ